MFVSRQLAALVLLTLAHATPFKRACVTRDLATSYDYVIVGGGASGLTVANRLSEDSCKTRTPTKAATDVEQSLMTGAFSRDGPGHRGRRLVSAKHP